jgi:hypothetical protein
MKKLFLLSIVITVFSSCEDELVPTPPPPPPPPNYAPMTVGDWWAYRMVSYNSMTGDSNVYSNPDTVRVLSDSVANGHTYYKLSGGPYNFHDEHFEYDSAGYVLYENGYLRLTYVNYTDTFWDDSVTNRYRQLISDANPTSVPAGTFSTQNFRTTYFTDFGPPCPTDTIYLDFQFTENVGVVRYSYHYSAVAGCIWIERQLVDYYVQ